MFPEDEKPTRDQPEVTTAPFSRRSLLHAAAAATPILAIAAHAAMAEGKDAPGVARPNGRAALVTGSSRGIGAAIAKRLARDGFSVTVNCVVNRGLAAAVVRDIELAGERNRGLYVLKSRGMKHSNQIREFLITSEGIKLEDVYVGPEGVLTGSMRAAHDVPWFWMWPKPKKPAAAVISSAVQATPLSLNR